MSMEFSKMDEARNNPGEETQGINKEPKTVLTSL